MRSPSRVLLVGEDSGITDPELDRLLLDGFQVDVARDEQQAEALCAGGHYDLALVDGRMPGADGVETLRRLRRAAPAMRAILITGYERADVVQCAVREGVEAIFQRPADVARFLPLLLA